MENKLQQLTEKLYNEGLSKGRKDADDLVAEAEKQSKHIISEAKAQAGKIAEDARRQAEELKVNTENEVRLASAQMMSALKQQIEKMIVAETITPQVNAAWQDGSFIKELVIETVKAWNPSSEDNALQVLLPEDRQQKLAEEVKASIGRALAGNVEVVTDSRAKVPFRIAPGTGGYYISFTDADFVALFKAYIRPKVSKLLFGDKNE